MSITSWNLGLDDAANGEPPRASRLHDPDYQEGYDSGVQCQEPAIPEPAIPGPSIEDLCAGHGHPYAHDDEQGSRCYCGVRREFTPDERARRP